MGLPVVDHLQPMLDLTQKPIVLGEFLVQTDRRLGLKVSQLVCRATLNRQRRPLLTQRGRQAGGRLHTNAQDLF